MRLQMTGRKGRVVQTDAGIQYESRSEIDIPLETLNLTGTYPLELEFHDEIPRKY